MKRSREIIYVSTSGSGISDKVVLLNTDEAENTYLYGDLDKNNLSIYAHGNLPKDYETLFCWGRDRPLTNFYDERGNELPSNIDTSTENCVMITMWIYIGD